MDANQRIAFPGVLGLVHKNTSQLYEYVHPLPLESPSQPAPRVITERQAELPALPRSFTPASVCTHTPLYSCMREGERLREVSYPVSRGRLGSEVCPDRGLLARQPAAPRAGRRPEREGGRPGPAPPGGGAPASSRSSTAASLCTLASRPDTASPEPTRLSPFDELRQAGHVRKFLGVRSNKT